MNASVLSGLSKRLVERGSMSEQEALRVKRQAATDGQTLVNYIVAHHIIDSKELAQAASEEFGLPLFDLRELDADPDVIKDLDEKLILELHALPIWKRGNRLFIALSDPGNIAALDKFKFHSGLNTDPVLVDAHQLTRAIDSAVEAKDSSYAELLDEDLDLLEFSGVDDGAEHSNMDSEIDDAPVVRYVNKVLLDAINRGASDIHFEPYENKTRVRFRLDGILQEIAAPPVNLVNRLISRLKVMARMDISERRVPQDGRIKMKLSRSRSIDFRVSTLPTLFGEKVVLRILDSGGVKYGIDALGFEDEQKKIFIDAIQKPHGMVLVTGPTGSGKTVTLYTALNILNTSDRNISSVEDPAEIYMPGVNQVNINAKVGMDFASTLRAFLRQDPDIIMVGEIRDSETAEIAMKAAQTGHMVLSTLHTNDAPQTLTRLLNMGVEPYNIVSAVSLVIAQRLVRRLCNHCKQPLELSEEGMRAEGFPEERIGTFTIFQPAGCDQCNNGYKGRMGIFQMMPLSEGMGRLIMAGGGSMELAEQADKEGIADLRRAGLFKVMQGLTSLEEVNRVTTE